MYHFLETMRRQSFDRKYEVILVDDCSADDAVRMVEKFISDRMPLLDTNLLMSIRIIKNEIHRGELASRNIAFGEARGDVVVLAGADCLYGDHFLASHFEAQQKHKCDVATGPQGIEAEGQPAFSLLGQYQASPGKSVDDASYRNSGCHESFLNCSSNNLSVGRQYVRDKLNGQLFDDAFDCKTCPLSSSEWGDVDLGSRIYEAGGRIHHLPNAVSVHAPHLSSTPDPLSPHDSLKGFRMLHEKHHHLFISSKEWTLRTFEQLSAACRAAGLDMAKNEDYRFLQGRFKPMAQPGISAGMHNKP